MPRLDALALLLLLVPAPLAAQSSAARAPLVRVDFGGPAFGIGVGTLDSNVSLAIGGHATVVHRSGHGVRVDFVDLEHVGGELLGPSPAHANGWMVDVAYAYRFRLTGDDRFGIALDLTGGLSAADLHFHQATNGFCLDACPTPPTVAENLADGAQLGANAGLSLDFRAYGFLFGIDARYRALLGLQPGPGDRLDQHVFTATAYLGFGLY